MLQTGLPWIRIPMSSLIFPNFPSTFSSTVALELTQFLTEMNTKNIPWRKGQTAACAGPIV
jgi:hypothetical protein